MPTYKITIEIEGHLKITKEIIISHKGTRMVEDEEDLRVLQTTNLEKNRLNF